MRARPTIIDLCLVSKQLLKPIRSNFHRTKNNGLQSTTDSRQIRIYDCLPRYEDKSCIPQRYNESYLCVLELKLTLLSDLSEVVRESSTTIKQMWWTVIRRPTSFILDPSIICQYYYCYVSNSLFWYLTDRLERFLNCVQDVDSRTISWCYSVLYFMPFIFSPI